MTETSLATPLANLASAVPRLFGRVPDDLVLAAARVFPAAIFWQSGRTKMDGWRVSDGALYLFADEYALPAVDPVVAAHLAAAAEHIFPALLVLGLATRLSALALLAMTAVIQIFVYPDAWPTHGVWAACFLVTMTRGAGAWSVDRLVAARLAATERPAR